VVSRKRVDRFVGSIGFVVSSDKVHEMLEEYQGGKSPEIQWNKAASSGRLYVAVSTDSVLHKYLNSNSGLWYLGFSFDAWDRVRFEAADNFSQNHHYQDYSLGYKFAAEMPNHTVLFLTPSVEFIHYAFNLDDGTLFDKNAVGGGFSILHSALPLGLKYVGFGIDGNYQSVLSLQLVF